LKTLSALVLLVYWSIIILAPVLAKDKNNKGNTIIYPKKKPNM
tara:strand:+ start:83 stop:211 length:129 start_codon:yes stop_codon:yes gene_type:complete